MVGNIKNYNMENIVNIMKENKESWGDNIGVNNIYFQTAVRGGNDGRNIVYKPTRDI